MYYYYYILDIVPGNHYLVLPFTTDYKLYIYQEFVLTKLSVQAAYDTAVLTYTCPLTAVLRLIGCFTFRGIHSQTCLSHRV